jgi:hypothetical protein
MVFYRRDRKVNRILLMYHDVYKESALESGFTNKSAIKYKIQEYYFEDQVKAVSELLRILTLEDVCCIERNY